MAKNHDNLIIFGCLAAGLYLFTNKVGSELSNLNPFKGLKLPDFSGIIKTTEDIVKDPFGYGEKNPDSTIVKTAQAVVYPVTVAAEVSLKNPTIYRWAVGGDTGGPADQNTAANMAADVPTSATDLNKAFAQILKYKGQSWTSQNVRYANIQSQWSTVFGESYTETNLQSEAAKLGLTW